MIAALWDKDREFVNSLTNESLRDAGYPLGNHFPTLKTTENRVIFNPEKGTYSYRAQGIKIEYKFKVLALEGWMNDELVLIMF